MLLILAFIFLLVVPVEGIWGTPALAWFWLGGACALATAQLAVWRVR